MTLLHKIRVRFVSTYAEKIAVAANALIDTAQETIHPLPH